jgi:ketosteroid isomerase-like protein
MEEVMADYSEESVLITPNATFKGLAEIRNNFKNAFITFSSDKTSFVLSKSVIDRDVAYILWQA